MNDNVMLRESVSADYNFIVDSIRNSLQVQFPFRYVDKNIYNKNYNPIIKNHIIKNSNIVVACSKEDNNQIFGFIIFEKAEDETILHYLYVKKQFRNYGIGTSLLHIADNEFGKKGIVITNLPNNEMVDNEKKYNLHNTLVKYKLRFDPFIILRRINNG